MANATPSWLDNLLAGYRTIWVNGAPVTVRNILNLVTGFQVTDNPTTGATELRVSALPAPVNVTGSSISWSTNPIFNGMSASATLTVSGATAGQQVHVAPPADWPVGVSIQAFVSAPNTVTIVAMNISGVTQTLPSGVGDIYNVRIYS